MDDILVPKSSKKFRCEKCDYITSRYSQYTRHISTAKHSKDDKGLQMDDALVPKSTATPFLCICGKSYKHRQGLWKHKKLCEENLKSDELCFEKTDNNVIIQLLKQNDEFKNLIAEQTKTILEQNNKLIEVCKGNTVNNNIQHVNSHNKTFNLNVFLNEHCKDAMNMSEFVDSLNLQLSDLENVGRLGFVEGISNIIVRNLKALDIHKRPVHCSDSKREVMYIKDENKWEKENDDKVKIRKVIKRVAHKNSQLLPEYKKKNPECINSESYLSDHYNKLIIEAMGGCKNDNEDSENKIIRKIAKEITIDKL